jgi:5-oxopent-3-ene-1,2,5-tricarboxylate decarboxylase/2-hydroxyhepta-2,4-diene-1,7-dioate isomerase
MKHARIAFEGVEQTATERDGRLLLADGRSIAFDDALWLPPLAPTPRPRTILALGLNYADHAKELEFKAPEEPLVFVKGQSTLIGHRQKTRRPPEVSFMHYECELVVVIGKTARNVRRADTCTPIGPWLVDAQDVPDPMALALQTTVNGKLTQSGSTKDMIFDVPFLIEYFSGFMTLAPGDLILTGTPDGVVDCRPGDVVVTEIEGIGALSNTIAAA